MGSGAQESGGQMNFGKTSAAYLAATGAERSHATLEYKTLAGAMLGGGHAAQESDFTVKGDGELILFRRGDFGERAGEAPGLWRAHCHPAEVEALWAKLADLGPHSFPARVADPGDTLSSLNAFFPNAIESLTWGPPKPGSDAPGDDFLMLLAPLMILALESRPEWAVEMACAEASPGSDGLGIRISFRNPGSKPIGLFAPRSGPRGGFTLRYALDRETEPGVTPLPVEWDLAKLRTVDQGTDSLWTLAPETPLSLPLLAAISLEKNRSYIGKIQFEQVTHLDSLAGNALLTGTCFTEVFEFRT